MERQCQTCQWWDRPKPDDGELEFVFGHACLRFPPPGHKCVSVTPHPGDRKVVIWPHTQAYNWCGEWTLKEDTDGKS